MNLRTGAVLGIAAGAIALGLVGLAYAAAGGGEADGYGRTVSGPAEATARTAALQAVPGGRAGTVFADSDGYDVLVTKPDGTMVKVELDKDDRFRAVKPAPNISDGDGD